MSRSQAVLFVPAAQTEVLFGRLGTHSAIAGAVLHLRDAFESTRLGRRVVVKAPSHHAASAAISAVLFQLCHDLRVTTPLLDAKWSYYGRNDTALKGPFPLSRMLRWEEQGYFADGLSVQDERTGCWVPLWFLLHEARRRDGPAMDQDTAMEDAEQLVAELNSQRAAGGLLLQAGGRQSPLEDFPELSEADAEAAEPMDVELSAAAGLPLSPEGVRIFLVADTNVLMSHMAFVERVFDNYMGAAREAREASSRGADAGEARRPPVEVFLVVPWVVLSELDMLKGSKRRSAAEAARHALHRLRELTADRDTYVRAQPAAEHTKAVQEVSLPASGADLRNDDMILKTALFYRAAYVRDLAAAGQATDVFLLSNDSGLVMRAQANGVQCFTARELPTQSDQLAESVPQPEVTAAAAQAIHLEHQTQPQQRQTEHAASPPQQRQQAPADRSALPASPAHRHASEPPSPAHGASPHQHQQQQMQQFGSGGQELGAAQALEARHAQQLLMQQQAQARAQAQQQQLERHLAEQQQQQEQQMAEQLQQLQLQAQHAAAAQAQAQAQAQQQAALAQAQQLQHAQAQDLAQQRALQHDRQLSAAAQAAGVTLPKLLSLVAQAVGLPPQQLLAERQQFFAGGSASPELEAALRVMQALIANPQQLANLPGRQAQDAMAAQQAAFAGSPRHPMHEQQRAEEALLAAAAAAAAASRSQPMAGGQVGGAAELQAAQLAGLPPEIRAALQQQLQLQRVQGQLQAAAAAGLGQQQQQQQAAAAAATAALMQAAQQAGSLGVLQEAAAAAGAGQGRLRQPQRVLSDGAGPAGMHGGQGRAEAAAAALLASRHLAAAGISPADLLGELGDIVAQHLAPAVKFHLQQDLGEHWAGVFDEGGGRREQWDARRTLQSILSKDGTFFWGVLKRDMKQPVKDLESFMCRRGGRGGGAPPPPAPGDVAAAARDLRAVMAQLLESTLTPPQSGDAAPPDPASIEGYVSQADAAASLDRGLARCTQVLAQLEPPPAIGPPVASLGAQGSGSLLPAMQSL